MVDIQTILSGALTAAAVGCLGVVAKVVGQYGTKIAAEVWKFVETKAKANNLEYILKTAKTIFYQVEEDFRVSDTLTQELISKADYFDGLLMSKIPSLNKNELRNIRQSIAGAYNEGKVKAESKGADEQTDTSAWITEEEAYAMKSENDRLKTELETANKKLNAAAKAITGINGGVE